MEVDECSAGGDSGAEEDEDDASSHGSRSNSSSSSVSGNSTSTESRDDSGEEHGTSGSETHSSGEEDDDDENENMEYSVKAESPDTLKWETCIAANTKVKLPQDLCEHPAIFREFLDYPYIWNECLTESQRETLCDLLPALPKDYDAEAETEKTLQMLFERAPMRFGQAPLDVFHGHLSAGHYRPDIKRVRSLVRKAQQRRLLFEERKRSYELAGQLLKSRESLLSNAYKQGFCQPAQRTLSRVQWRRPKPAVVEEKTQLRYLEELNALRTELGASAKLAADTTSENEENCPQYQMPGAKQKKKRRTLVSVQGLSIRGMQMNHEDETIRPVFSTLQRAEYPANRSLFVREHTEEMYREMLLEHKKRRARRDVHPELNTQGIALSDLTQRAQVGQKHKLTLGPSVRVAQAKKRIKLEQQSPLCPPAPRLPNSNSIKHESDNSDYSHTTDDNRHSGTLDMDHRTPLTPIKSEPIDAYEMHQMLSKKKLSPVTRGGKPSVLTQEIKKEVEDIDYDDVKTELSAGVADDGPLETEEDEENDKKELDLDGIDMMELPIQLGDGIDILDDVKCEDEGVISLPEKDMVSANEDAIDINSGAELMQETHSCFFSLLRDAFTSKGEYRMSAIEMKDAVMLWQGNPISPLNDWYSLASSWPALVPLALGFLAGELTYSRDIVGDRQEREPDLVPYLENKGNGVYAWIGAGRDSDSRLADLCAKFLMYKDALGSSSVIAGAVTTVRQQAAVPPQAGGNVGNNSGNGNTPTSVRDSSPVIESISVDGGSANTVAEWEPPRALWPTEWKVRASTLDEREEFRRQERMRYAAPHKAFTYKMHGYASVVGPVKGIYQHNVASGLTKARGHSLLVADRPNFVTILALVRDATARLPNGEGTRADICQLLKDSQYIREQTESDDKEGYLHSVVSGALDRLHYETDPCVRYYPRRKEWLYLHRARSESEFEMYHQQLQGVAKNKKNVGNMARNKALPAVIKPANANKEQSPNNVKEATPKKERKTATTAQPIVVSRKEQKKNEDKNVNDYSVSTEPSTMVTNVVTTISAPSSSMMSVAAPTVPVTSFPSSSSSVNTVTVEKDVTASETKSQVVPATVAPKKGTNVGGKPVAVVKTSAQSLLQSNQQHFPHHQIQVSTSAGLQTIRLSGHSVLHSAQSVVASSANPTNVTTNLSTILPQSKIQSQQQQLQQSQQQQQTIVANQAGKSILQTANIKQQQPQQQQQQHVLPGKTLLASQIKLVSSGQIKSLLTGHGLQGQTIFIKQSSPSGNQSQQIQQQQLKQQQQQQQQQQTLQQRVVTNQQQSLQTSGMQRIIAQIGGKPIAVQIQQSPQQQQQQQQQKILAKVLTSSGGGQLISVESLLAQKGLKLATTAGHAAQLNRQGKQVIQTQYQVVSQAQTSAGQSKIIASSQQQQPQQAQTVRMVTAQLAGKPIVLASGNKNVGVGVSSGGSVVLGKQTSSQQQQTQQQQQPIILPSQLLNIKTLHGLKVIPAGLKTTGAAVYARVIAPSTITSSQSTGNQQQTIQTQPSRNNTYNTP